MRTTSHLAIFLVCVLLTFHLGLCGCTPQSDVIGAEPDWFNGVFSNSETSCYIGKLPACDTEDQVSVICESADQYLINQVLYTKVDPFGFIPAGTTDYYGWVLNLDMLTAVGIAEERYALYAMESAPKPRQLLLLVDLNTDKRAWLVNQENLLDLSAINCDSYSVSTDQLQEGEEIFFKLLNYHRKQDQTFGLTVEAEGISYTARYTNQDYPALFYQIPYMCYDLANGERLVSLRNAVAGKAYWIEE